MSISIENIMYRVTEPGQNPRDLTLSEYGLLAMADVFGRAFRNCLGYPLLNKLYDVEAAITGVSKLPEVGILVRAKYPENIIKYSIGSELTQPTVIQIPFFLNNDQKSLVTHFDKLPEQNDVVEAINWADAFLVSTMRMAGERIETMDFCLTARIGSIQRFTVSLIGITGKKVRMNCVVKQVTDYELEHEYQD